MKKQIIYYIEYKNTVKFFNNDKSIDIIKDNRLVLFLKAVYKKYGKMIKFKEIEGVGINDFKYEKI